MGVRSIVIATALVTGLITGCVSTPTAVRTSPVVGSFPPNSAGLDFVACSTTGDPISFTVTGIDDPGGNSINRIPVEVTLIGNPSVLLGMHTFTDVGETASTDAFAPGCFRLLAHGTQHIGLNQYGLPDYSLTTYGGVSYTITW